MFRIEKSFRFEAAHKLPNHDGKCRELHGHSFKGTLIVEGDKLQTTGPKRGMLVDFSDLEVSMASMIGLYLDHKYLNDTLCVEDPTSEAIAYWVYHFIKPRVPQLAGVRIEETCTSSCEYRP